MTRNVRDLWNLLRLRIGCFLKSMKRELILPESKQKEPMNMKTDLDNSTLRKNSPLFWCTLVVPAAIIGLGINFILNPVGASTGFGIPIHDPAAFPFMWIKGIRDIFAGLVVLPFLLRGDRRTTATLFAIAIFIPILRWAGHSRAILALRRPSIFTGEQRFT